MITKLPKGVRLEAGGDALGKVSVGNSTSTLLTDTSVFTGEWEDVSGFDSLVVSVATDQDGVYTIQFSPDGVNQDSTLTRYYRTDQINVPHRFTITRQYARVVFTNNSGADQTYLRLQTAYGLKSDLNAPLDSTLAQDYDATPVRPSDYFTEVALGLRQGSILWNKFGYNEDIDTGSSEVIASFGGTFTPRTTATTLNIVSTSAADDGDPAGTGCNSIVIYGLDENRDEVVELVTLNGTTPVVTSSTWLGINRVVMFLCGSGQTNAGDINITATTGGDSMAQIPVGIGVTQQCIFHIPRDHKFIMRWLRVNVLKLGGGSTPKVTVKAIVFSPVSNGKQEIYRVLIDTGVENNVDESPPLPFPITEKSVVWIEASTDTNNTTIDARFSGVLVRDFDA